MNIFITIAKKIDNFINRNTFVQSKLFKQVLIEQGEQAIEYCHRKSFLVVHSIYCGDARTYMYCRQVKDIPLNSTMYPDLGTRNLIVLKIVSPLIFMNNILERTRMYNIPLRYVPSYIEEELKTMFNLW